ncbi:MAG: N-formylglutamate amidohydrolase [Proteobacteria bacterium]|nr:N-formylglutamate amidohydrolase [Pseudomonadota bacterium]
MAGEWLIDSESASRRGGWIPGSPGAPAFTLRGPEPSALPVLISVPHAGRTYPDSLLDRMRHPASSALRLEDRYADLLGEGIARETGAGVLIAHAPRAMIDLNRATDDVDWDMFARGRFARLGSTAPGPRARSGLGLIPRRLPGVGELWRRRHEEAELAERIDAIHAPYHACLADYLQQLRDRWGAALLLDLHSMPPLGLRGPQPPSEFVVGDRFGASCHGALAAEAFGFFAERRRLAAHNRPYAGGYVLERHAAPDAGLHAIQLEVDRSSYLDAGLVERGAGFAGMVDLLSALVRRLAAVVAGMGQGKDTPGRTAARWAEAAE